MSQMTETLKTKNDTLSLLLKQIQRPQMISGKLQDQVHSCVLRTKTNSTGIGSIDTVMSITALSKDGVSSLTHLSTVNPEHLSPSTAAYFSKNPIYITDISKLLGALKYHGATVNLTQDGNKLRVKSSNKQTTLEANPDATAYPNNPKSLREWEREAQSVMKRISVKRDGRYIYETLAGDEYHSYLLGTVDATDLYEALRCDSMNQQKMNLYTLCFFLRHDGSYHLEVVTGKANKGKTVSTLPLTKNEVNEAQEAFARNATIEEMYFHPDLDLWDKEVTLAGGLEQFFSKIHGDVSINLFDFTRANQGYKIMFTFNNNSFVLQTAIRSE